MSADFEDVSISVSTDANSSILLTIWTDIVAEEAIRVRLSPGRGATLLRDLANQVTYSLTSAATSIARGDCRTCRNVRMIQVPTTGGRETNDHCPDCRVAFVDSFPLVPQVGGGLA